MVELTALGRCGFNYVTVGIQAVLPIFIVHLFGNLSSKETEPQKVTMHAAGYEEVENKTVGETKPVLTS